MKEVSDIIKAEEEIEKKRGKLLRFRISKKYTFCLFTSICLFMVLILVHNLQFSEHLAVVSIVCSQLSLLVIAVVFTTGQAKIDLQASATYGQASSTPQRTHVSPSFIGLESTRVESAPTQPAPLTLKDLMPELEKIVYDTVKAKSEVGK